MWEVKLQYIPKWKPNKDYKDSKNPLDNWHEEYVPSPYITYVNWIRYSERWRKEFHYDEKQKYPKGWKKAKQIILDRDKYTCQICGKKRMERSPQVHHIDYDKSNISEDNLITVCDSCHRKTGGFKRHEWKKRCIKLMIEKGYRIPSEKDFVEDWKINPNVINQKKKRGYS